VIDGREELVGSDEAGLRRAISRAAARPHARVSLSVASNPDGILLARVVVTDVPADVKEKLRTVILVTEDGLTSVVKRGENGGRTLHHDAVVRRLSASVEIKGIQAQWRRDRLRVVALVQGEKSQRIFGAAVTPIQ